MALRSSYRLTLLTAAALSVAGPALAQQASLPGQSAAAPDAAGVTETVKLDPLNERRMTVPVRIDGSGPFNFVVDTGAERTVISGALARRLSLAPGRPVRMHSMTGAGNASTAVINQLEMSRKRVAGIHAPVMHEVNIGAAGILGIDTLQSQRIDFDFRQQKMTLSPSRGTTPMRQADPDTIVVTARSRFGRLIMADAQLEGEKVIVVLDTGSEVTIGNQALRRKLERHRKLKATVPIEIVSVTGGTMTADYTTINRMRMGGLTIEHLPIGFAEVHPFAQLGLQKRPALLLGMDALALFSHVSVDFPSRKVTFLLPDGAELQRRGAETRLAGMMQ
jgi:predicted aspartyl protease